jgi:hypothetical protein
MNAMNKENKMGKVEKIQHQRDMCNRIQREFLFCGADISNLDMEIVRNVKTLDKPASERIVKVLDSLLHQVVNTRG